MTMAPYLRSVASALRLQVRPALERDEGGARDALDNSVRVLTAVAGALDPHASAAVPPQFLRDETADIDRLDGPPENAAARRETSVALADAARTLDTGGIEPAARAAIAWEKALLDAGIAEYDAIELAEPVDLADDARNIDPAALQAYLRQTSGNDSLTVRDFRLITGGRSRQTAIFALEQAGTLPDRLVVQRGIPGQGSASSFIGELSQFRLLEQLHAAGMRVPRPVVVEQDPAPLGASFLIVEQSAGSPALTDYWRSVETETLVLDLAREMAVLHAQPVDRLEGILRPARTAFDAAAWSAEIEAMAAQWHALARWPSVTMSAAIAWLRAHAEGIADLRAIVHNDMVFHNILAENGRISAVLDWEQASIGHPGEDLGYCYPYVAAVMPWEQFMAAYRAAGGPDVPQRQIDFFALRAGLRLMNLVIQGGRAAFDARLSTDVLVASAGAHFTQRLLHRIATILEAVLARHG